jgi:hypothetical protein
VLLLLLLLRSVWRRIKAALHFDSVSAPSALAAG